jgi:FHA domain-containing protein
MCTIVIPGASAHPDGDSTVSREHTLIQLDHHKQFVVHNLNRRNSTKVLPVQSTDSLRKSP